MNRDIAATLSLAALSQLASFVKSVLIAFYFGIGAEVDGYYLAQVIPVTLAGIISGFLQTGFLTVYAGHLARNQPDAAAALLGSTLRVVGIAGLALSLVIAAAAPWLLQLVAPGVEPAAGAAATFSLRALAFLLVLNALADCLALTLNAHGSFGLAAFAPTVNALVATTALAAAPEWGLTNLVAGTLLGIVVQMLIVAYGTHVNGIRAAWRGESNFEEVFRVGSSIIPGLIFANVSAGIPTIVAAGLGEGAVAAFSVALRLHGAATQVFTTALSTVLLPHFALAIGRGDGRFIGNWLTNAFFPTSVVAFAVVLWVGLEGHSFVSIIYQRGAFDASASHLVAVSWFFLTLGLLPSVWGVSIAKVLQALRLGGIMSGIALLVLLTTILLSISLSFHFGIIGLSITPGIAALVGAIACALVATKRLPPPALEDASNVHRRVVTLVAAAALLTTLAFSGSYLTRDSAASVQVSITALILFTTVAATATVVHRRLRLRNAGPSA